MIINFFLSIIFVLINCSVHTMEMDHCSVNNIIAKESISLAKRFAHYSKRFHTNTDKLKWLNNYVNELKDQELSDKDIADVYIIASELYQQFNCNNNSNTLLHHIKKVFQQKSTLINLSDGCKLDAQKLFSNVDPVEDQVMHPYDDKSTTLSIHPFEMIENFNFSNHRFFPINMQIRFYELLSINSNKYFKNLPVLLRKILIKSILGHLCTLFKDNSATNRKLLILNHVEKVYETTNDLEEQQRKIRNIILNFYNICFKHYPKPDEQDNIQYKSLFCKRLAFKVSYLFNKINKKSSLDQKISKLIELSNDCCYMSDSMQHTLYTLALFIFNKVDCNVLDDIPYLMAAHAHEYKNNVIYIDGKKFLESMVFDIPYIKKDLLKYYQEKLRNTSIRNNHFLCKAPEKFQNNYYCRNDFLSLISNQSLIDVLNPLKTIVVLNAFTTVFEPIQLTKEDLDLSKGPNNILSNDSVVYKSARLKAYKALKNYFSKQHDHTQKEYCLDAVRDLINTQYIRLHLQDKIH